MGDLEFRIGDFGFGIFEYFINHKVSRDAPPRGRYAKGRSAARTQRAQTNL